MRGQSERQATMMLGLTPDGSVPKNHPLRRIKPLADSALERVSPLFDQIYAAGGRPSIPPEHLLKSSLLMAFYTIRSERQFCEQLRYNLLCKWFLDLNSAPHLMPGLDRWTTTGHSCPWQVGSQAQNGVLGLTVLRQGVGRGGSLQETLVLGAIALWNMSADCPDRPDNVQADSLGGVGRHQAGGQAQHPPIHQGRQVAADEGGVAEPGGSVKKGLLGFGCLEDEQHQRSCPAVVEFAVAAVEVAGRRRSGTCVIQVSRHLNSNRQRRACHFAR